MRGDPLTLVDTGPRTEAALDALGAGLRALGTRIEDLELILLTHHHVDHVGLAATLKRESGAAIAALTGAADYGARYADRVEADRTFSNELMKTHGVPPAVIEDSVGFWDFISESSERFDTDIRLAEGDTVRAGGHDLRVLARPGHSTTDTLFVDAGARLALVGDHLLAGISSNTEIYPVGAEQGRPSSRIEYLRNLERTAELPLETLLTGHGPPVTDHAALIRRRSQETRRRCDQIIDVLSSGASSAYDIAVNLWSSFVVSEQPLLVVWEVIGHLDLLIAEELVQEHGDADGRHLFSLMRSGGAGGA